ncbi:hypothetical protein LTR36_002071 [Oleoguttula mirabilis]|uniref:Fungal N-terminal domain-containing protein n=1 Tax=Oleoguttula mirabilis TaxID=1507867 RepID=A0AAV9JLL2_9PEZI|nr:hypothetical protein LTR36_002071 [Oleoguttula mirabilis]
MDPFSLTVGIIGVVDGGISLSERLKGKIDDYRNAKREVEELTHEIDLCTTLLDVLGDSLDRPESAYPKNVARQTRRLVEDMRTVFADVESLIADFDYSIRASSKYMIDAGSLRGHHDRLKALQLSFIFMQSICPPQRTPAPATAFSGTIGQLGSFEGTIQHVPVYTGASGSSDNTSITYKATLTLQASPSNHGANTPAGSSNAGRPQDLTDRLEEVKKNKRLKRKLAALTSNPFFSRETLGAVFSKSTTYAATYSLIEPRMRTGLGHEVDEDEEAEVEQYVQPRTEKQAESDVDDILTYLFDDDSGMENRADVGPDVVIVETAPGPSPSSPSRPLPYPTVDADQSPPSRYSTPPTY